MTDFKKDIDDIKKLIESKNIEKAKLEQKLEDLEKEKKEIDAKLKELNIGDVEELVSAIKTLEKEIAEGVTKCQTILS